MIDRFEVASYLRELAMLLSMEGENKFKVRAYQRGAEALERLDEELATLIEENRLVEVPYIGQSISAVIAELWRTGTSAHLERLRPKHPRGLVELYQVEGLSEQRIHALREGLGIDSIEKLREALDAGTVTALKGFGPKTVERIKSKLDRHAAGNDRIRLPDALDLSVRLTSYVRRGDPSVVVGETSALRRRHEVIDEIALVTAGEEPEPIVERFAGHPQVLRVESRSKNEATVRLADGMRASIAVAPPAKYAAELLIRTGSAGHVAKLEARAAERGWSLAQLEAKDEEELYRRLDLPFIPPELREDLGEIEAAAEGRQEQLLTLGDVRGMVHCHTQYSDGRATVEEMALAADALGIQYLTITDHSPSAFYAQGVEIDRLKQQWDEIAEVQERVSVRLLRGTESDILADGSLDYPDAILEQLDVIIASIHSRHQMGEDAMTERIVRAMKHPCFKIWGHPLGRLVLKRDPVPCRVEEILDVISESRAAIEISGDPVRMDLEPRWVREARTRGIPFVVSVDAHSTKAYRYLDLGVTLARRGGVTAPEVLNTLSADAFLAAVRPSS